MNPSSATAPNTNEYAGDEISAIVLDPGYSSTRAGFAGEDIPKSVIPSYYGIAPTASGSSQYLFGENSIHNPLPNLEIKNPWSSDGIVEDWDTATKLWEYAITSRLTGQRPTDPTKNGLNDGTNGEENGQMDVDMDGLDDAEKPLAESPLLMTEPGLSSAKAREKYIEIAMEDWGTPAFYLGKTGVLAAFASGKASGIVIDIGASTTTVTPIVDGLVLKKGVQKSPLAGNYMSNQLRLIFAQSQPPVPLTPHFMVASKSPVDAGAPAQAIYKKFEVPPTASFRRFEEERVLTEFKESVVETWNGPNRLSVPGTEESLKSAPGRPFEMPDGYNQLFSAERFKVAEGLFDASSALHDPDNPRPKDEQTIPRMVQAAIHHIDVDLRPLILGNVIITGGASLTYRIMDRINNELSQMFPAPRIRLIAPGNTIERKYAAWIGGSILASLGSFHQLWISKKEYEEHGPSIIDKRIK
ncbi:Actin/actin-like protein [Mytilinidion resinicola]|uniref:Actin/actin-like protein n=1 Tax=Mytilinidion resinicola TaxID=574789 RepID=A0A6A6Y5I0_9PEZI|nr:Actin/actin-like protein [Mytilinidion resinicola]KAF2803879.1 Actin/actin-like protein [Mytilinidion resinicola]